MRRILVLEDNAILRRAIGNILADHQVTMATTAEEAADACLGSYDLVLSDVDLGAGGTGMEFYEWVETNRPDLVGRFHFMTGGIPCRDLEKKIRNTGVKVWDKPMGLQKLLGSVLGGVEGE